MSYSFVLRFEEPVREAEDSLPIQAGTKAVTEVSREAGDNDPTTHFAINRNGGVNADSIRTSVPGSLRG
jgi:hypothetical protein